MEELNYRETENNGDDWPFTINWNCSANDILGLEVRRHKDDIKNTFEGIKDLYNSGSTYSLRQQLLGIINASDEYDNLNDYLENYFEFKNNGDIKGIKEGVDETNDFNGFEAICDDEEDKHAVGSPEYIYYKILKNFMGDKWNVNFTKGCISRNRQNFCYKDNIYRVITKKLRGNTDNCWTKDDDDVRYQFSSCPHIISFCIRRFRDLVDYYEIDSSSSDSDSDSDSSDSNQGSNEATGGR